MEQTELTLGQALAYVDIPLKAERKYDRSKLTETDKSYLQTLRQHREEIISKNCVENIFAALPDNCCQTERPHLADNLDLFIARFLITPVDEHSSRNCQRLTKHLNDCFMCFKEFSEVLRDYFHKSQELSQK